jgi:hypothetical protein
MPSPERRLPERMRSPLPTCTNKGPGSLPRLANQARSNRETSGSRLSHFFSRLPLRNTLTRPPRASKSSKSSCTTSFRRKARSVAEEQEDRHITSSFGTVSLSLGVA